MRDQVVCLCFSWADGPTRPRAPKAFPTTRSSALRQFAQHGIVLHIDVDDRFRIVRLERLLEQSDLTRDARDEPIEDLDVVYRLLDDLLVRSGTIEPPLPVRVVVAERE